MYKFIFSWSLWTFTLVFPAVEQFAINASWKNKGIGITDGDFADSEIVNGKAISGLWNNQNDYR